MSNLPRHRPKIGAGTPAPDWLLDHGDLNLHALGPGDELLAEWRGSGLSLPDRPAMRAYRIERVRDQLRRSGCDGIVLYDPVNIRYASDTTNMSLWTMHNPVRYLFVATDGPAVLFEFSEGEFLGTHSGVVDEVRAGQAYGYFFVGDRMEEAAGRWADELVALVDEHGRGDRRLAVDMLELSGVRALEARGLELVGGMPLMEEARKVKCADEISAMRCAIDACQRSVAEMRAAMEPGITEMALWGRLQEASFRRYGEWVETRLLSSGPRTNPWYHEASSRRIQAGELVGFDTDLIGAYGGCVDMSRTWLCGSDRPTPQQQQTYDLAREQIERNIELHVAGAGFREVSDKAWYPPLETHRAYTCLSHGVGLCDEYPALYVREGWDEQGYHGVLEPGMVMCVEAFVGPRSGGEGVKLEQQVLITETGNEVLTDYPLDLLP